MERSHATVAVSDSPTPRQMKEFWLQVGRGQITHGTFQVFLRRGADFKKEEIAREILGNDIIFPNEIAEVRGLSYSEEQLERLAGMFPSEEVLHWCKANNYAVMACPPEPMSLLEVRVLKPELLYSKSGGWYIDQAFAEDDKTDFGWLAICKDVVPKSLSKDWNEQLILITGEERVPNAGEFSWFITTYYEVHGVRLFEHIYARTSSVNSGGNHVYVGRFDSRGLSVAYYWDDDRDDGLGVSSARKF